MTAHDTFEALKYRIEVDQFGTRRYYNAAGHLHREGGPAIEYAIGTRVWYINGKVHRTDGPAVEWPNSGKEWYINGIRYTEKEFNDHTRHV